MFLTCISLLIPAFSLLFRPPSLSLWLRPCRMLLYHFLPCRKSVASVSCFSPVTFSAQVFSTSELLRTLASPKAISRRTSYLRVRLEFLRYPHLITTFFNTCVFGPPKPFTVPSTWTWIGHPVSGLLIPTLRPIQTWFPFGSDASDILTSLALVTRRTVLQKVRHQPVGL